MQTNIRFLRTTQLFSFHHCWTNNVEFKSAPIQNHRSSPHESFENVKFFVYILIDNNNRLYSLMLVYTINKSFFYV